MAVRARITGVFLFFTEAELLHVCVRFAVPTVLLFLFV